MPGSHHIKMISKVNNINNIAFQSQASWGRLELKPHHIKMISKVMLAFTENVTAN